MKLVQEYSFEPDQIHIPEDVDEEDVTIEEIDGGTRVTIEIDREVDHIDDLLEPEERDQLVAGSGGPAEGKVDAILKSSESLMNVTIVLLGGLAGMAAASGISSGLVIPGLFFGMAFGLFLVDRTADFA